MGEIEVKYMEVPSVQELAKKKLVTIPSRYVRDDQDRSIATSNYKQVPVIDMQRLINSNDHDSMNLELNKLHFAAKDWGFFQVHILLLTSLLLKATSTKWINNRIAKIK